MEQVLNFFGTVGTIVAVIGIFDLFATAQAKDRVSWYLFGYHDVSFSEFERNVVWILMSPFIQEGQLILRRILYYSMAIIFPSIIIFGHLTDTPPLNINGVTESHLHFAGFTVVSLSSAIFTLPFDYWSLWITKKIFIDRRPGHSILVPAICIDLVLSIIPAALLFGAMILLDTQFPFVSSFSETTISWIYGFAGLLAISMVSSVLITGLQVVLLLSGMFFRLGVRATRYNFFLSEVSRIHEFPFTFVGLILGIVVAIATL